MKKVFISVILLFAFHLANAQDIPNDSTKGKWELGMEGGYDESYITGSYPVVDVGHAYYYLFGVTGQYNFNKVFSIKTGVSFERKGFVQALTFANSSTPGTSPSFDTTNNPTTLDYITIPVMAKATFGHKIRFFVNGGLYFGYLVGQESKYIFRDSVGKQEALTRNEINEYKRFDLGVNIGIGIEMPIMNKLVLDLEGRLSNGFLDNGFPLATGHKTENASEDLLLGLRYKL